MNGVYKFSRWWRTENKFYNAASKSSAKYNVTLAFEKGLYNLPKPMAKDLLKVFRNLPVEEKKKFYSAKGQKLRPQGLIRFLGYDTNTPGIITSNWKFINFEDTNTLEIAVIPDIQSSGSEAEESSEEDSTDDDIQEILPPRKRKKNFVNSFENIVINKTNLK